MARDRADDARDALVSVEQLAYGLHALDVPVWEDFDALWRALDRADRDDYVARARFALGIAEQIDEVPSGEVRWPDEPEVGGQRSDGVEVLPVRMPPVQLGDGPSRWLPETAGAGQALRITRGGRPHPVQLGDARAVCTCGRWRFEDEPEPAKHISGCAVTQLVGGPGQPSAQWVAGQGDGDSDG